MGETPEVILEEGPSFKDLCFQASQNATMTKGSRPEQAVLTRDTDMSKTEETRKVIEGMVDGLNDHRIADIGEFFTDGQRRVRHQEQSEGVPGQLAETLSGRFLGQGVHRRGEAVHGGVGRCLWTAGGEPFGRVHGDRTHGKADRDSLHGLLEGGRREDCRQLGLRRLPPRDGSIGQGCFRRERVGSLRPRRTHSTCTKGKIKTWTKTSSEAKLAKLLGIKAAAV